MINKHFFFINRICILFSVLSSLFSQSYTHYLSPSEKKKSPMSVKSTGSKFFEHTCDWNIYFYYLKKFMSFNRRNSGNFEFWFKKITCFEEEKISRENSVCDPKRSYATELTEQPYNLTKMQHRLKDFW